MTAEGISVFFSEELWLLPLFSARDMGRAEDVDDECGFAFFAPTCPPRGFVPHSGKLLEFGDVAKA
jgi:hypothetical protein